LGYALKQASKQASNQPTNQPTNQIIKRLSDQYKDANYHFFIAKGEMKDL